MPVSAFLRQATQPLHAKQVMMNGSSLIVMTDCRARVRHLQFHRHKCRQARYWRECRHPKPAEDGNKRDCTRARNSRPCNDIVDTCQQCSYNGIRHCHCFVQSCRASPLVQSRHARTIKAKRDCNVRVRAMQYKTNNDCCPSSLHPSPFPRPSQHKPPSTVNRSTLVQPSEMRRPKASR